MIVKDLMEKLKSMPKDSNVLLECSNCGYRTDSGDAAECVKSFQDGSVIIS